MRRFVESTRGSVVGIRERCWPGNRRAASGIGPRRRCTRRDALALLAWSHSDGVHQAIGGGGEVIGRCSEGAEKAVAKNAIRVLRFAVNCSDADAVFESSRSAVAALQRISKDSRGSGINDSNAVNGVVLGPARYRDDVKRDLGLRCLIAAPPVVAIYDDGRVEVLAQTGGDAGGLVTLFPMISEGPCM